MAKFYEAILQNWKDQIGVDQIPYLKSIGYFQILLHTSS